MGRRFDIAVAGGGPVGLAVAIEACRAGLSVCVHDKREPPIDKACGEGLMPAAIDALERLGVRIAALPGRAFVGLRYLDARGTADVYAPLPDRPGRGVRRTSLHEALARRAAEAGAELRWRTPVVGLAPVGLRVGRGAVVRARWVVGADGLHSRVRRWSSIEARRKRCRYGVRRHYEVEPWTDAVEVYWGDAGETYVTPVGPRCVGVALLTDRPRYLDRPHEGFDRLERRLSDARPVTELRGAGPFDVRVSRVVRGRCLLAGDAAGYADPISGEGIGLGLEQARALVDAIVAGVPGDYERAHARTVARHNRLVRTLLAARRYPPVRRRLLRVIARRPELFQDLLHSYLEPEGGRWRWAVGLARALIS